MPKFINGDIHSSHWNYHSKQGEIWKVCPVCGDDVPLNQMKRDPSRKKLVCPDCLNIREEEEEI